MQDEEAFIFLMTMKVRIGDVNYGGHMGNASFIQYFQEARLAYLDQFGFSEQNLGNEVGMILVEIHCELKGEAFHQDQLDVFVRVSQMKRARFTMNYKIIRVNDQKLIALGYSVQAAFDYKKRKPVALPQAFQVKISEYESF